jgi:isopentenyl-diphosphate delta-isomerase
MDKVVIVDENDKPVGLEDKAICHSGKGILHRAFSVLVFNPEGQLLLQQRSKNKLLWPLYWSNTCCSHPLEGETYEQAGRRRLQAEMGFVCNLRLIGTVRYQASYRDKGSENEVCAVLIGEYDGEIKPDPEEVATWKWVDFEEVKRDVSADSDKYSPWFKIEIEKFFGSGC